MYISREIAPDPLWEKTKIKTIPPGPIKDCPLKVMSPSFDIYIYIYIGCNLQIKVIWLTFTNNSTLFYCLSSIAVFFLCVWRNRTMLNNLIKKLKNLSKQKHIHYVEHLPSKLTKEIKVLFFELRHV